MGKTRQQTIIKEEKIGKGERERRPRSGGQDKGGGREDEGQFLEGYTVHVRISLRKMTIRGKRRRHCRAGNCRLWLAPKSLRIFHHCSPPALWRIFRCGLLLSLSCWRGRIGRGEGVEGCTLCPGHSPRRAAAPGPALSSPRQK